MATAAFPGLLRIRLTKCMAAMGSDCSFLASARGCVYSWVDAVCATVAAKKSFIIIRESRLCLVFFFCVSRSLFVFGLGGALGLVVLLWRGELTQG